ncbi:MAG: radical SAM protein [Candidatus Omnitrophica bacterium]|nr:radical SAM protein [Candidatus Omnitrophota bacterium]MDD5552704.1 radical SAM protein [Candidatus Omnitrophota bacterium]
MPIKNPKTCLLTVTNNCVLRCKMCHLWRADTGNNEISIGECKRFVDSLGKFGPDPMEVHLIGGESLIKEGVLELIRYINDKGYRTVITSSGYTIDGSKAKALVDSGLAMLNLSLESLNPNVHDFLRGREGCLDRVKTAIDNLDRIERKKMKLGINSIISGANLDDILELTEWVQKRLCLDSIYFMAVMRPFGSGFEWEWFKKEECKFLWPSETLRVETVLDKLIALKKKGYKIENPVGQLEAFKAYFKDPFKFVKANRCNVSEQAINVNALGDAYLCFFMEKLGNIKTDNIVELWHSQKAERIRGQMRECRNNCELVINCYYKD